MSSGIVQTLIFVLAKVAPELCMKLCDQLVDKVLVPEDDDKGEESASGDSEAPKVTSMFEYMPVCRTVETVLGLPGQYGTIKERLFKVKSN